MEKGESLSSTTAVIQNIHTIPSHLAHTHQANPGFEDGDEDLGGAREQPDPPIKEAALPFKEAAPLPLVHEGAVMKAPPSTLPPAKTKQASSEMDPNPRKASGAPGTHRYKIQIRGLPPPPPSPALLAAAASPLLLPHLQSDPTLLPHHGVHTILNKEAPATTFVTNNTTLTPMETPLEALPITSLSFPTTGAPQALHAPNPGEGEVGNAPPPHDQGWSRFQPGSLTCDLAPLPKPRFSLASPLPPHLASPLEEDGSRPLEEHEGEEEGGDLRPPAPPEVDFDSIVKEVARVCQQCKIPTTPSNIQVRPQPSSRYNTSLNLWPLMMTTLF